MRNFSNLDNLLKLKNEICKENNHLAKENKELQEQKEALIKEKLISLVENLKELAKYQYDNVSTGIELNFFPTSATGTYPSLIYRTDKDGNFWLETTPDGYRYRPILFNSKSNNGWNWGTDEFDVPILFNEEAKHFFALNKEIIIDTIEHEIARMIIEDIENSSAFALNTQLKDEIEKLKTGKQPVFIFLLFVILTL